MARAAAEPHAVRLEGVRFAYPGADRPLLEDLDLTLARGELAAVLGPSGVGKSTLLNLVAGLAVPEAGRVTVLGTEVTALDESAAARWRRAHLGFVFQQFHLLPYLTVAENVALPLALQGERWEDEGVRGFLGRLGLAEQADAYPRHLSGGQAQRTAIARALIHRPPVLLADELTGNLDEETAVAVMDLLVEAVEELGTTTLVVTHAPEVASRAHTRYRLAHHRLHRES
ncbi:MAG: ABC transporter ATP-binding protein [Thiohalorhabdus sp.]|uniref:ABC transporter ATP-binding protein n=1 Tax=Thiohalorhabdus sp. TaxID=3094134 RepID=UPI00398069CA